MIKSMTAFAAVDVFKPPFKVRVEARSYNSRYLDIFLKITRGYQSIEEDIKRLIAEKTSRGRVEVIIKVKYESEDSYEYVVNMSKAEAFFKALDLLSCKFDLIGGISADTLIGAGDIIRPVEVSAEHHDVWTLVGGCLETVMHDMDKMKKEEGRNLADDFNRRLNYIEKILGLISSRSSNLPELYRNRLKERIEKLASGLVEIDHDRIIHEASILATKSDISEEIVRSASHIKQFRNIMRDDVSSGKKLNFLMQELNREFNTMGSKIGDSEISHMIVSAKFEFEKIKEQIQNVE